MKKTTEHPTRPESASAKATEPKRLRSGVKAGPWVSTTHGGWQYWL